MEDGRAGEVVELAAIVCVELDGVGRDEVRVHVQEDGLGRDRVFARELCGLALVDHLQVFRQQHLGHSAAAVDHLLDVLSGGYHDQRRAREVQRVAHDVPRRQFRRVVNKHAW